MSYEPFIVSYGRAVGPYERAGSSYGAGIVSYGRAVGPYEHTEASYEHAGKSYGGAYRALRCSQIIDLAAQTAIAHGLRIVSIQSFERPLTVGVDARSARIVIAFRRRCAHFAAARSRSTTTYGVHVFT